MTREHKQACSNTRSFLFQHDDFQKEGSTRWYLTISLRLEGSHACTSQRVPSHLGHSSSTGSLGTSSEGDLVELSHKSLNDSQALCRQ